MNCLTGRDWTLRGRIVLIMRGSGHSVKEKQAPVGVFAKIPGGAAKGVMVVARGVGANLLLRGSAAKSVMAAARGVGASLL